MPPRALDLARACHPGPTLLVVTLTTTLAALAGRSAAGTALVAVTVLSGQLPVGWTNDVLDAGRDRIAGRRDKPVAAGRLAPAYVLRLSAASLLLCVPLSMASGWRAGLVHLAAVAAALAYNVRLKSTAWSWVPFAVAFGLLPAFVSLGLPGHPAPAVHAVAAGALFGVAAHGVNTLPDLADDRLTGVRGLPHRLGARRTRRLVAACLLLGVVALAAGAALTGDWLATLSGTSTPDPETS